MTKKLQSRKKPKPIRKANLQNQQSNPPNVVQWYKKDIPKLAQILEKPLMPKARLTVSEANILASVKKRSINSEETAKSTEELLAIYLEDWPGNKLTIATASTALQSLRDNWFFQANAGLPYMKDKTTKQYGQRKKMRNWLSQKAQTGEIDIDPNRWVMLNGEYIADEMTRRLIEDREQRKLRVIK